MEMSSREASEYVWGGEIPLQIHLHESEVTALPPPPPALILGPRIGYLPLLVSLLKPHFSSALPPGVDTVWFDYKGLPLKWYIPTGVLFDLLCLEPERPWNLTIHFRGYPSDLLTPCEGEDSVKWSFINSLKEAAYIINGNCKNVMNMSQADQLELWQSITKGQLESHLRASSRLKLGPLGVDCILKKAPVVHSQAGTNDTNSGLTNQTGRIPVHLYVRYAEEGVDDLEDASPVESWDNISYINRPVDVHFEEGKYLTLRTAMESLLPDFFSNELSQVGLQNLSEKIDRLEADPGSGASDTSGRDTEAEGSSQALDQTTKSKVMLVRIQGIEPELDIPLAWVFNNMANPEYFLHICLIVFSDSMVG